MTIVPTRVSILIAHRLGPGAEPALAVMDLEGAHPVHPRCLAQAHTGFEDIVRIRVERVQ